MNVVCMVFAYVVVCFKQKTAYEMRISDWSSDVCSSDLSASCASSCMTNLSTTRATTSGPRLAKVMVASSRLRNSGENMRLIASMSSPVRCSRAKPMAGLARSAAPALVEIGRDTSELQSLMRISYAVFCLKKKNQTNSLSNSLYLTEHR